MCDVCVGPCAEVIAYGGLRKQFEPNWVNPVTCRLTHWAGDPHRSLVISVDGDYGISVFAVDTRHAIDLTPINPKACDRWRGAGVGNEEKVEERQVRAPHIIFCPEC
jgi:hypothetical protein